MSTGPGHSAATTALPANSPTPEATPAIAAPTPVLTPEPTPASAPTEDPGDVDVDHMAPLKNAHRREKRGNNDQ